MPPGRSIGDRLRPRARRRASAAGFPLALLALLGLLAGCSHPSQAAKITTTTHPRQGSASNPVPASLTSVVAGRYVESVAVGTNFLEVSPAPAGAAPQVDSTYAASLFDAYRGFSGTYEFDVLGLGNVTIDQPAPAGAPSSPTTSTTPTTAAANTTAVFTKTTAKPATSSTTTTTTASSSTTSSSTTTTSSTVPPPTTTTVPPLPAYSDRLAWVGIAVAQEASCAGGSPATVALVIDAYTGHDVLAVTDNGCASSTPKISRPYELESVPWTIVGASSTAVTATIPACGSYFGWTELMIKSSTDVQVQASVPYDPQCSATATEAQTINLVVPLGSTNTDVPHAPVGRIDNLEVLP